MALIATNTPVLQTLTFQAILGVISTPLSSVASGHLGSEVFLLKMAHQLRFEVSKLPREQKVDSTLQYLSTALH